MIQNPKFNIVECIEDVDKLSVDSVTTLARDSGIDPEFPISKLRKKVYLFGYEGRDEPASKIPSSNLRSLQQMNDLPYYLSAVRYSSSCMFPNISDDDLMKILDGLEY
ncbi:uncharacterized protein TNIN_348201 [Trichonephila inaurata madagascariensis]|uniref:Uncharacterized protein n=1 Tax=Trichonephila inaurata madagascariensis TaxID=2747483 RepID=A0A8X6X220_9ARAC|nr:uncharacterized protein TNIN_348201 [Trichonephila inaurata madagascariensis]